MVHAKTGKAPSRTAVLAWIRKAKNSGEQVSKRKALDSREDMYLRSFLEGKARATDWL